MDETIYYVYKITNNINKKIYIGQHRTKNINDNYMGSGYLLKRAYKKYGIENFSKTILEYCQTQHELNEKEQYYIKLLNSQDMKIGYNIIKGGSGLNDYCKSLSTYYNPKTNDEIRIPKDEKIPEGYIKGRRPFSNEWISKLANKGEKNGMYGTHRSGSLNPCYGKKWIHNIQTKEMKYVDGSLPLPVGWAYGQKDKSELKPRKKCYKPKPKPIPKPKIKVKPIKVKQKVIKPKIIIKKSREELLDEWSQIKKQWWKNKKPEICPHCGKEGRGAGFYKWHMNNCKYNPNKSIDEIKKYNENLEQLKTINPRVGTTTNKKCINNGYKNKFVKIDEINEYLNNGWKIGMIKKQV